MLKLLFTSSLFSEYNISYACFSSLIMVMEISSLNGLRNLFAFFLLALFFGYYVHGDIILVDITTFLDEEIL